MKIDEHGDIIPMPFDWNSLFGPAAYTHRDAVTDLLRFADLTSASGNRRQTPYARSWRCRFARQLMLALRGVP